VKTLFGSLTPAKVGVKICGITNPADLALCLEAGADALGFNFYTGSKRCLDLGKERGWLVTVPDSIMRVAVVVNPTLEQALRLLREPFLDALQLHGEEDLHFCEAVAKQSGKEVIKAIRVQDATSLVEVESFADFPVLLDAFAGHERGGTGKTFDWALLDALAKDRSILLSGGLQPQNVAAALRKTQLRYVDVASGVETAPREKSAAKIREFIAQVRQKEL
jgi:phosphoribosylanthranilate isomerase